MTTTENKSGKHKLIAVDLVELGWSAVVCRYVRKELFDPLLLRFLLLLLILFDS